MASPIGAMRVVVFIAALASLFASAQAPPPTVRDPAAIAAVQNSIAALGGTANIQISDCTVQGTLQNSANPSQNGSFTWKTSGTEFNYSTQTGTLLRIVVSGHGVPADIENGVTAQIGVQVSRATQPWHVPGLVLLNELNNTSYALSYVGQEVQNGASVIHVKTTDNSDDLGATVTPQDWYFDSSSYLPVSVSHRIPDPLDASRYTTASITFGGFTQLNGIAVASSLANIIGDETRTVTITSVVFNSGLPSSTFDAPVVGGL